MTLYHDSVGNGPPLVLLHGWGLHAGVWTPLLETLAQHYTVTLVDLPGHGRSRGIAMQDADHTVGLLLEIAPPSATWLGWSLGGMLALKLAATAPQRVNALVMVAALPSFVARDDFPYGMPGEVFAGFAAQLETGFDATLLRFLSLQTRGVENGNSLLRELRETLSQHGKPDPDALRAGLAILQGQDLRAELAALTMPVKLILGERDTLVSSKAAVYLQEGLGIDVDVIPGAAHLPFVSHQRAFSESLQNFMQVTWHEH